MSQRTVSTSAASVDALRLEMERSIDDLAELARSHVEPGKFFTEVLRKALQPGGASSGVLWRLTLEGAWEQAGEMPPSGSQDSAQTEAHQKILQEVAQSGRLRILGPDESSNGQSAMGSQVFSPLCHEGQTVGILQTRHLVSVGENLASTTYQFFAAVGEIAADFLCQQELKQLRQHKLQWQQWDHYAQQLGQSPELADVCAVIANDGRTFVGCDRISLLIRRGNGYRLQSVTGVERINPRAGSVRSLESVAEFISKSTVENWLTLTPDNSAPASSSDQPFMDAIRRHAQESGVSCFGALGAPMVQGQSGDSRPLAIITFEAFQAVPDWPSQKARAEMLVRRSSQALRAALDRDSIPWLSLWSRIQKWPLVMRRPITLTALLILIVVIPALFVIPAEFSVTGRGELWPDHRREIFASTSGIVEKILVEHGAEVQQEQPLIVLRDPQLDQEMPKIVGEIATLSERLKGVLAARLTGAASESISRFRQLSADEEELKERLKTLELQRKLLLDRQSALTLRSPIAGQVLTWDVRQHLDARPVDRGQALLTIGETQGSWIVEVRVADKDVGHILRGRQSGRADLNVDFMLPTDPGRTFHGTIRDVGLSTETDDQSSGFVRVVVEFDRREVAQLRPGATVIPRIRCGRQSIAYVWWHDLFDTVRSRLLF